MAANRGAVWSRRETLLLLQLWRDEDIEAQLQGCHRNQIVYSHLADLLKTKGGYQRTTEQCRSKIKKTKSDWAKIRENENRSGTSGGRPGLGEEEMAILNEVLGTRPIHNPRHVVDTMAMPPTSVVAEDAASDSEPDENLDASVDSSILDASNTSFHHDNEGPAARPGSSMSESSHASTASVGSTTAAVSTKRKAKPKIGQKQSTTLDENNEDDASVNNFALKKTTGTKRKRKATQDITDVLSTFLAQQEKVQQEFRQHESSMFQKQLEAEKELRAQEFNQNMQMMKMMMGFSSNNQVHTKPQGQFSPVPHYPPAATGIAPAYVRPSVANGIHQSKHARMPGDNRYERESSVVQGHGFGSGSASFDDASTSRDRDLFSVISTSYELLP